MRPEAPGALRVSFHDATLRLADVVCWPASRACDRQTWHGDDEGEHPDTDTHPDPNAFATHRDAPLRYPLCRSAKLPTRRARDLRITGHCHSALSASSVTA